MEIIGLEGAQPESGEHTPGGVPGVVYLLHFDDKLKHAQHYIGWSEFDLDARLEAHGTSRGSKIMRAVKEHGITVRLARLWYGDRHFERKLKNRKKARALCPYCRGEV